jgi:hypothetical protein
MSLTNGYDNRVALAQGAGFALVADIAMARLTPVASSRVVYESDLISGTGVS